MSARAVKKPRAPIGTIRRAQIVEAAVAIIAEQGLDHLSLSAIEKRAGMSRGQLTYYFHTKEDILLAVFDQLLETMHLRMVEALHQRANSEAAEPLPPAPSPKRRGGAGQDTSPQRK